MRGSRPRRGLGKKSTTASNHSSRPIKRSGGSSSKGHAARVDKRSGSVAAIAPVSKRARARDGSGSSAPDAFLDSPDDPYFFDDSPGRAGKPAQLNVSFLKELAQAQHSTAPATQDSACIPAATDATAAADGSSSDGIGGADAAANAAAVPQTGSNACSRGSARNVRAPSASPVGGRPPAAASAGIGPDRQMSPIAAEQRNCAADGAAAAMAAFPHNAPQAEHPQQGKAASDGAAASQAPRKAAFSRRRPAQPKSEVASAADGPPGASVALRSGQDGAGQAELAAAAAVMAVTGVPAPEGAVPSVAASDTAAVHAPAADAAMLAADEAALGVENPDSPLPQPTAAGAPLAAWQQAQQQPQQLLPPSQQPQPQQKPTSSAPPSFSRRRASKRAGPGKDAAAATARRASDGLLAAPVFAARPPRLAGVPPEAAVAGSQAAAGAGRGTGAGGSGLVATSVAAQETAAQEVAAAAKKPGQPAHMPTKGEEAVLSNGPAPTTITAAASTASHGSKYSAGHARPVVPAPVSKATRVAATAAGGPGAAATAKPHALPAAAAAGSGSSAGSGGIVGGGGRKRAADRLPPSAGAAKAAKLGATQPTGSAGNAAGSCGHRELGTGTSLRGGEGTGGGSSSAAAADMCFPEGWGAGLPSLMAGFGGGRRQWGGKNSAPATTITEAQEKGEQVQMVDDATYALDGLAVSKPGSASQRESAAKLLRLCLTRRGRAALRADGLLAEVLSEFARLTGVSAPPPQPPRPARAAPPSKGGSSAANVAAASSSGGCGSDSQPAKHQAKQHEAADPALLLAAAALLLALCQSEGGNTELVCGAPGLTCLLNVLRCTPDRMCSSSDAGPRGSGAGDGKGGETAVAVARVARMLREGSALCRGVPPEEVARPQSVALLALVGATDPQSNLGLGQRMQMGLRSHGLLPAVVQLMQHHSRALSQAEQQRATASAGTAAAAGAIGIAPAATAAGGGGGGKAVPEGRSDNKELKETRAASAECTRISSSLWSLRHVCLLLEHSTFACPENECLLMGMALEEEVAEKGDAEEGEGAAALQGGSEARGPTRGKGKQQEGSTLQQEAGATQEGTDGGDGGGGDVGGGGSRREVMFVEWMVGLLARLARSSGNPQYKECTHSCVALLMNMTQNARGCQEVVAAGGLVVVAATLAEFARQEGLWGSGSGGGGDGSGGGRGARTLAPGLGPDIVCVLLGLLINLANHLETCRAPLAALHLSPLPPTCSTRGGASSSGDAGSSGDGGGDGGGGGSGGAGAAGKQQAHGEEGRQQQPCNNSGGFGPTMLQLLCEVLARVSGSTSPCAAGASPGGGAGGSSPSGGSSGGEEVTLDALHSNESDGQASIIEAYAAMLLGYLVADMDAGTAAGTALPLLPQGGLDCLTAPIARCLSFYLRTGAMTEANEASLRRLLDRLHTLREDILGSAGAPAGAAAVPADAAAVPADAAAAAQVDAAVLPGAVLVGTAGASASQVARCGLD